MYKSVGVLIAAMMVAPASALAGGKAWQLGFTYDCCPIGSNSNYHAAPQVNQTVIVQTAGGKVLAQVPEDDDNGLDYSGLGVDNSVDGPYIVRRPYGHGYVRHFGKRQFRRSGHIRVY